MDKSIMFPGVGVNANIDLVCIKTASLRFATAMLLLRKFGYEQSKRIPEGYCEGVSVVMVKDGCVSIQLTDPYISLPVVSSENYIRILVDDPETVWLDIKKWTRENGVSAEMKEVPGGILIVSIPEVVNCVVGLVPNPDTCPECRGKGTVLLGCEGQVYDTTCFSCDGAGYKKK